MHLHIAEVVNLLKDTYPIAHNLYVAIEGGREYFNRLRGLVSSYLERHGSLLEGQDIEDLISQRLVRVFYDESNKRRSKGDTIKALNDLSENIRSSLRKKAKRQKIEKEKGTNIKIAEYTESGTGEGGDKDTLHVNLKKGDQALTYLQVYTQAVSIITLDQAIKNLPEKQQRALLLSLSEKDSSAIAKIMDVHRFTVDRWLESAQEAIEWALLSEDIKKPKKA
jgi:DNA-directed RNA polymerase specialized sigma24 family protein